VNWCIVAPGPTAFSEQSNPVVSDQSEQAWLPTASLIPNLALRLATWLMRNLTPFDTAQGKPDTGTLDTESHDTLTPPTGEKWTSYYYAGGQRIAMRTGSSANSSVKWLLGDHLDSTSLTAYEDGTYHSELRYKPWGEERYVNGETPTDFTYTGQKSNTDDFGLMYYVARFYDPALGRFTSADTVVPEPLASGAWDRYAYNINNPIKYTDPTGHGYCDSANADPELCDGNPNDEDLGPGGSEDPWPPFIPPAPGSDVTEYLVNEMNAGLEFFADADKLFEDMLTSCLDYAGGHTDACYGNHLARLLSSHLEYFGNGGLYDIKRKMLTQIGFATILCGGRGCEWLDYSVAGNILFGYLSGARGVPQGISWGAGGLRQSLDDGAIKNLSAYGDDPADKAAVDFGYALYQKYPEGITLDQFKDELTADILASFQQVNADIFAQAIPQENAWATGHFLNE